MKIILSYKVKFRVAGITLGTVEGERDLTDIFGGSSQMLVAASNVFTHIGGRRLPLKVLVNDRGVYIALEGR